MNSEELEQSLRSEFESYLKAVVAEMKQDVAEFQSKIDAEFGKHKSQIDEAFQGFAARFDSDNEFDQGFRESVIEHLRLARDEGAKLSANAFAEAEKLESENGPTANFEQLRDAISDISSKDSQSAILKSLVEHASSFAPRGAFFIIKNEHFVGWKVFGDQDEISDGAIREIHFPTAADSILGQAVASGSTAHSPSGSRADDSKFLEPLQFDQPGNMYAIPLVARGRSVAVMYADQGTENNTVNVEALETIVRVAALTVELVASSQSAKAENRSVSAADFEDARHDTEHLEAASPKEPDYSQTAEELPAESPAAEDHSPDFAFSDNTRFQNGFPSASPHISEEVNDHTFETSESVPTGETPQAAETPFAHEAPYSEPEHFQTHAEELNIEPAPAFDSNAGAMVFDSGGLIEPAAVEKSPFESAVDAFDPVAAIGGSGHHRVAESGIEVAPSSLPPARLSDRPVDLPIEVPEEERRLHNDARRFARLLVSEIKLYNEKKVLEGRQSHDLYDRLREAIDRSREMYDKRVQPPVAARFDYFHYELLNSLAEGNTARFGDNYPGATI